MATATPHIFYRSNDFSIFCFCPFKSFCFSYRLLRSMTSFDCTILLSSCCNFFCCFSNFSFSDSNFSLSSASVSVCSFKRRFVAESSDTSFVHVEISRENSQCRIALLEVLHIFIKYFCRKLSVLCLCSHASVFSVFCISVVFAVVSDPLFLHCLSRLQS